MMAANLPPPAPCSSRIHPPAETQLSPPQRQAWRQRQLFAPHALPTTAGPSLAAGRQAGRAGMASVTTAAAAASSPATSPADAAQGQAGFGVVDAAAAAPVMVDRSLFVKISLASSTGRLDLSDCGLEAVPPEVFELQGLEELSLAGNRLHELPPEVSRLVGLRRLQLSGNLLRSLPPQLGELGPSLEGLWLHGNLLREVPQELGRLTALTQLSLAGNRLECLPEGFGKGMDQLQDLGLAGNRLSALPASLGTAPLPSLVKLALHGNRLEWLPERFGEGLPQLKELWLQGNRLRALPESVMRLQALRELSVADNLLEALPVQGWSSGLQHLHSMWLYGNRLTSVPPDLAACPSLTNLWLEGNRGMDSTSLAPFLEAVRERQAADDAAAAADAARDNGAGGEAAGSAPAAATRLRSVGLEERQLGPLLLSQEQQMPEGEEQQSSTSAAAAAAGSAAGASEGRATVLPSCIKVGTVVGGGDRDDEDGGSGPGYFKLQRGHAPGVTHMETEAGETATRVLVIAMGSAPGVPNWGGLLGRVYSAAQEPCHRLFDVLYVVDPHRAWYGGGESGGKSNGQRQQQEGDEAKGGQRQVPEGGSGADQEAKEEREEGGDDGRSFGWDGYYEPRLRRAAKGYGRVLVLGDSMGATAALLAAPLATSVHAFCPQVDLQSSSIRPGQRATWMSRLTGRCTQAVAGSSSPSSPSHSHSAQGGGGGDASYGKGVAGVGPGVQAGASPCSITVHVGHWRHDLDQARALPQDAVRLEVYSVDSHRLALYLDSRGKLLPLVRGAILNQMGLRSGNVRPTNLL